MDIPHDPAADGQHPDRASPAEPKGRMLNAAQVAEILGGSYTAATVVRRYRHWELTAFRVGRELRWWEADVYEWIKNRRVNLAPAPGRTASSTPGTPPPRTRGTPATAPPRPPQRPARSRRPLNRQATKGTGGLPAGSGQGWREAPSRQ
jgi:hypothetical protein